MRISPSRSVFPSLAFAAAGLLFWATSLTAGINPPGYPPFPAADYKPAGLSPKEPEVLVDFPGGAITRGIAKGNAVVSVMISAEGKATDYLVIGCSDLAFGTKLLDQAKGLEYQAAKFKGVAVPARYNLGYTFESKNTAINPMDAARHRMENATGLKLVYTAVAEKDLDKPLEFTNAVLPRLPEGYPASENKPVKVFVTFYIDEEGHVRAPTVESAASPELIPGAIDAVLQWSFKPATVKGKPALVFSGRAVRFVPRQAASVQSGGIAKNY